jgi:hypothetical protein
LRADLGLLSAYCSLFLAYLCLPGADLGLFLPNLGLFTADLLKGSVNLFNLTQESRVPDDVFTPAPPEPKHLLVSFPEGPGSVSVGG